VRHLTFAACAALVAGLLVAVIGYGYEINAGGSVLTPYLPVAGLVLLLALGTLIWTVQRQGGWAAAGLWQRRAYKPTPAQTEAFAEQTARQTAYAADPAMRATCAHLQPIEGAMRAAGVPVRLLYGEVVDAHCVIDEARLTLEEPLVYHGNVAGDRPGEPPSAHLHCPEHNSSIALEHPQTARPSTPVFPGNA
jgi:hypothetical protein